MASAGNRPWPLCSRTLGPAPYCTRVDNNRPVAFGRPPRPFVALSHSSCTIIPLRSACLIKSTLSGEPHRVVLDNHIVFSPLPPAWMEERGETLPRTCFPLSRLAHPEFFARTQDSYYVHTTYIHSGHVTQSFLNEWRVQSKKNLPQAAEPCRRSSPVISDGSRKGSRQYSVRWTWAWHSEHIRIRSDSIRHSSEGWSGTVMFRSGETRAKKGEQRGAELVEREDPHRLYMPSSTAAPRSRRPWTTTFFLGM